MIRKAVPGDLPRIAEIYSHILEQEEQGLTRVGWQRGIYPTEATARQALEADALFVLETEGVLAAAGRIDQRQVDIYAQCPWLYLAPPEQVMVLHTLVVEPSLSGRGYATRFVRFYEQYALEHGCPFLRIDTNARNRSARQLYQTLGFREAGILPCDFNGISQVQLVCLEKHLGKQLHTPAGPGE